MPLELYAPGSEAQWLRSFTRSLAFRPRFFETDALGHVSNVSYTMYIEHARTDFLNALDDPERRPPLFGFLHQAAEIAMRFLAPCYFDEELVIRTRIAALGRSSLILEHAITSAGADDVRTIACVVLVGMRDGVSAPWSDAQRAILAPRVVTEPAAFAR